MVFLCKGCGRPLFIPRAAIEAGKTSDLRSFDVPPHPAKGDLCEWSGRAHVEGAEQMPEGRRSTELCSVRLGVHPIGDLMLPDRISALVE